MTPWDRAQLALALLARDPIGLGGVVLRGRVGPARDALVASLDPVRVKLHPNMGNDALDGSIDLAATLATNTVTHHAGLLSKTDQQFSLAMAERTPPYLAARLAAALDAGAMRGLVALDEGVDDEGIAVALSDRLAFHIPLDDIALADITPAPHYDPAHAAVDVPSDLPEQLVVLAVRLGITSLRAPVFALRTASAHARLMGRNHITDDDVTCAVALVFTHRATQLPADDTPPPPEPEQQQQEPHTSENIDIPDDILLEAVLSALPAGLLDTLTTGTAKGGKGAGSGRKIIGNRRGRPLPARDATARANARVDLIATLRAAIPWQTMRKAAQPERTGPIIRPSDLRAKRYQDLSDRVLIFAVDASGSAAVTRLNEAKGAIEILLSEAYARRDHVALIAFRGDAADVLLPPTRSLVQTKRRLAALPGGGGTPLAAGLDAAADLALATRKRGQTPTIVVLTDGRANIARDGTPNRVAAATDAIAAAGLLRGVCDAIMIDTGLRPDQSLHTLANTMGATYIPLPRADARRVSDVVTTAMND